MSEQPKPTRGRPKTNTVRLGLRVKPRTKMRILAMVGDGLKTPGMVVDQAFDKEAK